MSGKSNQNFESKANKKVCLLKRKEKHIPFMLHDLLSCITPHPQYKEITSVIKKYLPKGQKIYTDGAGNLIVKVGENYTTMFSCHIDMVFRKSYLDGMETKSKKLDLFIAGEQGFVWGGLITEYKDGRYLYTPTTLGADDKAGIFILIHLIRAKIPGLYIFHIGEEVGGLGSLDIKNRKPGLVKGIKRAIAFDRMDYLDIINRQRGSMCCSFVFVNALSDQLTDLIVFPHNVNKRFKAATGTFTDTANYVGLIPECTNLSVGYFCQHGSEEYLNTLWLTTILTPALIKVDWESLPTERIINETSRSRVDVNGWPTRVHPNVESIRKYAPYKDIDYTTISENLPPWGIKKGHIKSCKEVGMRRLVRKYLKETLSEFQIQQDIIDLLKENYDLKQRLATEEKNYPIVPVTKKKPKSNATDSPPLKVNEKKLFDTLVLLTNRNFQICEDHSVLYTNEIFSYAEMLKWAWEDFSKYEETSFSMGQLFSTVKEILAEILVINSTLVEEINFNSNNFHVDGIDSDTLDTITQSVSFFKNNWFVLGYNTYADVQDEFRRIRDKITTPS